MDIFTTLLLSLSLAVDAVIVSLALGLKYPRLSLAWKAGIAICFGLFQAVMPLGGWLGATVLAQWIEPYDHWIAFGLLSIIGLNMIKNAWRHSPNTAPSQLNILTVLSLGVATSIDALAVGFGFPVITTQPWLTSFIIGIVTTTGCSLAVLATHKIPSHLTRPAELTAGMILMALGIKLLLF